MIAIKNKYSRDSPGLPRRVISPKTGPRDARAFRRGTRLKKNVPGKIDLFDLETRRPSNRCTVDYKRGGHVTHDGYRRGRAGDAPLIAKLGRNGVGLRPDQSAKTLCLNSKHRTREALDKILETLPRQNTSRFKSS